MKKIILNTILFLACSINSFAQFGADYSSYGFNFINDTYNDGLKGWTGSNLNNPSVNIYRQDPTLNNYALQLNPTNETVSINYNDCGYMDLNPCSFTVNWRAKVNSYSGNNDNLSFQLFSGAVKVELELTQNGIFYTNSANVSTLITATPPPVGDWKTYTISVNSCNGNATLMIENDASNIYPLNLPTDASPQNINLSASTDGATPFSAEVDHLFIHSDPVKWWLGPSTAFVDDTPTGYPNTTGDRQHFLCLPNGESIGVNEDGGGYVTFTELMPGGPNLDPRPKFGSGGTKTIRAYFHTNEYNPVQAGVSSESGGHLVDVSTSPDKSKVTVDTFPLHNYAQDGYIENSPIVFPDGTTLGDANPLVINNIDNDVYDEFGLDMRHELMTELDFHTCLQNITRCGEISTVKHSAEWEYIRHPAHLLQFHEVTQRQRPNFGGSLGSDTDLGEMRHKFEFRLNRDLGYEYVLCKDANNQWQSTHLTAIGDDKQIDVDINTPKNQRFMVFSTSPDPDVPGAVAWYYPESTVNSNGSVGKSRNDKSVMYTDDRRTSVRIVADWRKTNWMRMNLYVRNEGLMAPSNGECDTYEAFQMEAHQLFGTPNEIMMEVLSYCEESPITTVDVTGGTFCAGPANFSLSGTPNTIVTYNINGGTPSTVTLDATGMATVATSNASTMNLLSIADLGKPDCSEPITGSADVSILNMIGTYSVIGGTFCAEENANFSLSGTPNTSVTYNIDGGAPMTINLDAAGIATIAASNTSTLNLLTVASSGTANCMESLTANVTIIDAIATPNVTGGTFCAGTNAFFSLSGDPNIIISYNINGGTPTAIMLDAFGKANIPVSVTSTLNLHSVAYPTNPSCSRTITGSVDLTILDAITAPIVNGSNTICNGDPAAYFTFTGPANSIITYTLNEVQAAITLDPSGTAILPASNISTSTVSLINVNDGGCIATFYEEDATATVTITVETCVYTWSFIDPCNCENPNNITLADGSILFSDFIRVDASQFTNPSVSLSTADANFLDNTGAPIDAGTATFVSQGGGIYELPFYTRTDAPASFVVDVNGDQRAGNSDACSCPIEIPTLTQWGLSIYGLLILNIFVGVLYRKEKEIVFD